MAHPPESIRRAWLRFFIGTPPRAFLLVFTLLLILGIGFPGTVFAQMLNTVLQVGVYGAVVYAGFKLIFTSTKKKKGDH